VAKSLLLLLGESSRDRELQWQCYCGGSTGGDVEKCSVAVVEPADTEGSGDSMHVISSKNHLLKKRHGRAVAHDRAEHARA